MIMRSSAVSASSNSGSLAVETFDVLRHTFGVAAVAVFRVEVDEVREDQTTIDAAQGVDNGVHFGVVVGGGWEVFA